jgi:hypothetical protein
MYKDRIYLWILLEIFLLNETRVAAKKKMTKIRHYNQTISSQAMTATANKADTIIKPSFLRQ